jgi:RimJ/RimL family protein N-acetyltransferase
MDFDHAPTNPLWGRQPTISDERLTLRPFHPRDAWAMVEWDQDPETQRFLEFPRLPPYDEHLRRAWWVIRALFRAGYERGERVAYVVVDARSGEPAGSVDLHDIEGNTAELSYMTVRNRRGTGVARDAVRLLCSHARERFGITRITLGHHLDNRASEAVATSTGFSEVQRTRGGVRYERTTPR